MSATAKKTQKCPATKRNGEPCTGTPLESGYCFAHDPAGKSWRSKGGKGRATPERVDKRLPSRLAFVVTGLEDAFKGVRQGTFDPQQAHALARLASALIAAYAAVDAEPSAGERAQSEKLDKLLYDLAMNR